MYISSCTCMLHSHFIMLSLSRSPKYYLAKTNFIIPPLCTFLGASVTSCIGFGWKVNHFLDDHKIPCSCGNHVSVFVFFTGPRSHVFEIYLFHLACSTELISSLEIFLSCAFSLTPCILIYSQFMPFRYTDRPNVTPKHRRQITVLNCLQSAPSYCTRVAAFHLFPFLCCTHIYLTHWGRSGSFKLFKRPLPGVLTILTL